MHYVHRWRARCFPRLLSRLVPPRRYATIFAANSSGRVQVARQADSALGFYGDRGHLSLDLDRCCVPLMFLHHLVRPALAHAHPGHLDRAHVRRVHPDFLAVPDTR